MDTPRQTSPAPVTRPTPTPRGRIVVGLDRTEQSLDAARFAVREARRTSRSVELVNAYPLAQAGYAWQVIDVSAFEAGGNELLEEACAILREELGTDVEIALHATPKPPAQAMVDASRTADLVVVGRRDATWGRHLVSGSVSASLASRAHGPVVVVPVGSSETHDRLPVVVAVDARGAAEETLRLGFEEAEWRGVGLRVLHVTEGTAGWEDVQEGALLTSETIAGWRERYSDLDVSVDLVEGDVGDACVRASLDAGLLVVGRPRADHPGGWMRSTARTVVQRVRCPAVVVPRTGADGLDGGDGGGLDTRVFGSAGAR